MESIPYTPEPDTAPIAAAPVISIAADTCPACGTRMAADQRYCVECGQRRVAPRLPSPDAARGRGTRPANAGAAGPQRMAAATTLIAVIGTLLLAMGIGVFIGRADSNPTGKPATQVVTVVSAGGGPAIAPAGAAATTTTPAAATGAAAAASAAKKKAAAKKAVATPPAAKAPPKAVHVGSPGSGPGYQNGKFTGNFF